MKLTGSYKMNVKKEAVWKALNDPNILKQCIPGCESFDKESSNIFNANGEKLDFEECNYMKKYKIDKDKPIPTVL